MTRVAAIGLLVALALGCGAIAEGLRYNGTPSYPVGFYLKTGKHAQRGDLVLATLPVTPVLDMARDRGYLNVGYCTVGHILKRLVGIAGDRVTIDSSGVQVNGITLANSAPLPYDRAGRPLTPYTLTDHALSPSEVFLMSDYNPASFDSRYFGPLPAAAIECVVRPLVTWN